MGGGGRGKEAAGVARTGGERLARGGADFGATGGTGAAARRRTPRYGRVEGHSRVPFGEPNMGPCIALGNGARDKPPTGGGVRAIDL